MPNNIMPADDNEPQVNLPAYLLGKLMQECGEATQSASKCQLFGFSDKYGDRPVNRDHLVAELADICTVVRLLEGYMPGVCQHLREILNGGGDFEKTKARIVHWMHHSSDRGNLTEPVDTSGWTQEHRRGP